jgi:hypothetical protein
MSRNEINLSTALLILSAFALGCGSSFYSGVNDSDNKVERGRLKFAKSAIDLNTGTDPIYRKVRQYFFVDGKEWTPEGDEHLAERINWCDTSPNPKVEILRCFGDSSEQYSTTYILRMRGDKPEVQKIDEGMGSVWTDDDGRWLLFRKLFLNVETGERVEVKGMPFADYKEGSAPVQYVVGVSPDRKTVVAMPDSATHTKGAEDFLTLWIIDAETGRVEKREVSFTKNPWLKDYKQPENGVQPPPAASKKMVWAKDQQGELQLVL